MWSALMRRAAVMMILSAAVTLPGVPVHAATQSKLVDTAINRASTLCSRALEAKDEQEASAIEIHLQKMYMTAAMFEEQARGPWQAARERASEAAGRVAQLETNLFLEGTDAGRARLRAELAAARQGLRVADADAAAAKHHYTKTLIYAIASVQVHKHVERCLEVRRMVLREGAPGAPPPVAAVPPTAAPAPPPVAQGGPPARTPVADASALTNRCVLPTNTFGCSGSFASSYTAQCRGSQAHAGTAVVSFEADGSFFLRLMGAESPLIRGRIAQSGHVRIDERGPNNGVANVQASFVLRRGSDGATVAQGAGTYIYRADDPARKIPISCRTEFTVP